jgi:hypothetical protein
MGLDAYSEKRLVRLAVDKLKIDADQNILDTVEHTDVVEIINSDHTQVYRSFSCFALCNYTIAELVTYHWYELYERPSWVQERLYNLCEQVLRTEGCYVDLEPLIPAYTLRETMTPERASFKMSEKFYSRMNSSLNQNPYLISVKKIEPLEEMDLSSVSFI